MAVNPQISNANMVPKTAQPWPGEPVMRPSVTVSAAGMRNMSSISRKLLRGVGFSNGWALLVLKNPPPFVPSILIASCEATGPWPIV